MAARGRIYRRGRIYYIAYRWDGREYRESARSTDVAVAERLLATRVAERRGHGHAGVLTFDDLVAWYLDDYEVRRLRTLNTARGRVANLRATFGARPATAITPDAIRAYQRTRRAAGAAAATVNRETSALSRMLPPGRAERGPRPAAGVSRAAGGAWAPAGLFRTRGLSGGPPALAAGLSGRPRLCLLFGLAEARDSGAALERGG